MVRSTTCVEETQRLLELGSEGGYIFSPAHDVPKDVPLENMLAMIDLVQHQPGYITPILNEIDVSSISLLIFLEVNDHTIKILNRSVDSSIK